MMNYIIISILLLFAFKQVNSTIMEEEISFSKHECEPLLQNFSFAISNFTYCSVNHARPVSLCNKCVSDYILILRSYKNLTQTYVNGTACIDNFINLDRLQVVDSVYRNAKELWSRARCDECLSFTNGSLSPQPSKVKKEFDALFETFIDCTNGTNVNTVCDTCMNDYIQLNSFYFKIGDITHGINGLCMDIVDLMNETQAKWSNTCCKYRVKDESIYISTIVVMFALPVIFYILVKFLVDIKRPTLLLQNRFAESINTPSTSYRRESL